MKFIKIESYSHNAFYIPVSKIKAIKVTGSCYEIYFGFTSVSGNSSFDEIVETIKQTGELDKFVMLTDKLTSDKVLVAKDHITAIYPFSPHEKPIGVSDCSHLIIGRHPISAKESVDEIFKLLGNIDMYNVGG